MQLAFVMSQMELPNVLCLIWFEMACVVQAELGSATKDTTHAALVLQPAFQPTAFHL